MNGFQLFSFCQESFLLRAVIAVSFWKARKEKTMFSEEEPVLKILPLFCMEIYTEPVFLRRIWYHKRRRFSEKSIAAGTFG